MSTLNRAASELMIEAGVNACTDVTGFGLLGHACEMIEGANVGMVFYSTTVPLFPEVREFAVMGLIPGGTYRNKEFRSHMVEVAGDIPDDLLLILFDAQTSGGLLISIPPTRAEKLLQRLHNGGAAEAAIIGEVVAEPKGKIIVR